VKRKTDLSAWLLGLPLLLFLVAVPAALLVRGRVGFGSTLSLPGSTQAISVSLRTTFASLLLLVIFGTPLAAAVVRVRGLLGIVLETILDLPLVLPPAAAGIGLLLAFGRQGLLPTHLPFTAGAVVAAQIFVSAPIYIRSATAAFRSVPEEVLAMAEIEGAGPRVRFFSLILPLTAPTLTGGAAMAWARGLGEFGATILFAGSLEGKTETLPLAIYLGFEDDLNQAIGLSLLLLLIAAVVLASARVLLAGRSAS
jgi:molybdate transport system permease protein